MRFVVSAAAVAAAAFVAVPAEAALVLFHGSGITSGYDLDNRFDLVAREDVRSWFSFVFDTEAPFIAGSSTFASVTETSVSFAESSTQSGNHVRGRFDFLGGQLSDLLDGDVVQLTSVAAPLTLFIADSRGRVPVSRQGTGSLTATLLPANYTGGLGLIQFVPGVPEPATWGMMIAGFGLVGGAMRRSRRVQTVG